MENPAAYAGRAFCPQSAVHFGYSIMFAFGIQGSPFEVNGCLETDSPTIHTYFPNSNCVNFFSYYF